MKSRRVLGKRSEGVIDFALGMVKGVTSALMEFGEQWLEIQGTKKSLILPETEVGKGEFHRVMIFELF